MSDRKRLDKADAMLLESEIAWLIAYGWRVPAGATNWWHAPRGEQKTYLHSEAVAAQKRRNGQPDRVVTKSKR